MMGLKETIIESLGLVEIKEGGTVRRGQTYYTFDFYEDMGEPYSRVIVERGTASEDFNVHLDEYYCESIKFDDLNPGSVVSSSEGLFFVIETSGEKCFVNSSNCIYRPEEVEIDEVIYYA